MYSEEIFREALEELDVGLRINGMAINNIRYADDSTLLATSPEDLQILIDRRVTVCKNYGLELNTKITKIMIISQ